MSYFNIQVLYVAFVFLKTVAAFQVSGPGLAVDTPQEQAQRESLSKHSRTGIFSDASSQAESSQESSRTGASLAARFKMPEYRIDEGGTPVFSGPPARCDELNYTMPLTLEACEKAAKKMNMKFEDDSDRRPETAPRCGYDAQNPGVVYFNGGGSTHSLFNSEGKMGVCAPIAAIAPAVQCQANPGFSLSGLEATYAKCPPGNYISPASREIAENRLQAGLCLLKSKGFKAGNLREEHSFKERGYVTYESSLWPKPERCSTLIDENWINEKDRGVDYRNDFPPDSMQRLYNKQYKLGFNMNWKVATTSFPQYLWCEYGDGWSFENISAIEDRSYRVVFATREPVARFISGVGELLQRANYKMCPGGPCSKRDGYDDFVPEQWAHETTWYNLTRPDRGGFTPDKISDLMRAMVLDAECNYYSPAAEHFTSQATFATQNTGPAAPIETTIKLEATVDYGPGLEKLSAVAGKELSKSCALGEKNSNKNKDNADKLPSADKMRQALEADDEIMQQLCLMYMQDYVCFGYGVPRACQGLF